MKVYVSVPRKSCAAWWPKSWSEMVEAARAGVDGMEFIENPGGWRDKPNGEKVFVETNPFTVKGAMAFRPAGRSDGFDRDDVATLHSQGW